MSRLVDYGTGEIVDRLTVLALKVLFGTEAGKDIAHFTKEQAVLLGQLGTKRLSGAAMQALLGLAAVNAALWHAEDDLRVCRQSLDTLLPTLAGELAFRIQALNDQRAGLVALLNKEAGDGTAPEKL